MLFVTARDDEIDRVLGLEMGADDYVTKPFSPRELVARVRTVLRRSGRVAEREEVLAVGEVRIEVDRRRAHAAGAEVALTSTEFDLLTHLMRAPGRVFTREQLLSAVWGYTASAGTRTVDVHVAQLRAKLGPASPMRTVRGRRLRGGPALMRRSLAWRVAASCLVVALVAVAVAAVVALRLVSETARQTTQAVLAQEADIVAAQLADPALVGNPGPARQAAASRKLVQTLQAQGVDIVLLAPRPPGNGPGRAPRSPRRTPSGRWRACRCRRASTSTGRTYVVEARPALNGAFALVRRSDTGPLGNGLIRRNLGFALLAGIAVALVVGLVVGTLMARPLRRTAAAAHLLRGGRRDVRVPVRGPAEVAEVAGAVNDLADALARSEARQREFLLSGVPRAAHAAHRRARLRRVAGRRRGHRGRRRRRPARRSWPRRRGSTGSSATSWSWPGWRPTTSASTSCGSTSAPLAREAGTVWDARCRAAGVVFSLYAPPSPVWVTADPRRLRQVVDGLAENALRVTTAGASLAFAVFPGGVLQVRDGGPGPRAGGLRGGVRPRRAARALPRPPPRRCGRRRPGPGARPGHPHGRHHHRRARPGGRGVLHRRPARLLRTAQVEAELRVGHPQAPGPLTARRSGR